MDEAPQTPTAGGEPAPASGEARDVAGEPPRAAPRGAVASAFRIWISYAVPLTVLSAIALSPLLAVALRVPPPRDAAAAKSATALGWTLIATAWLGQLVLVGAAAGVLRAPGGQLRALASGLGQLIRAVVPCAVAAAAIAIGGLALVVPAPVLLVLLSLTGASRERGLRAPLADSIAAVRRGWPAVALAVAALLAIDAAIAVIAHRAFVVPLPRAPAPAQLAGARDFVRAIAIALVVVSPLPATLLAALRARLAP